MPDACTSALTVVDVLLSVSPSAPGVPVTVAVGVVVPPLTGSTQKTHFALRLEVPAVFLARTCQAYWPLASAGIFHDVVDTQGLVIDPSLTTT